MMTKEKPLPLWRCPACGKDQRARASSVGHTCPVRERQPAPEKGKHKLPMWVEFVRIVEETVSG